MYGTVTFTFGFFVGILCGYILFKRIHTQQMSSFGEVIAEGRFQSEILAALTRLLFQPDKKRIFEVKADNHVWRVWCKDDNILYERKK